MMNYTHQQITQSCRRAPKMLPPSVKPLMGSCITFLCLLLLLGGMGSSAAWAGQRDVPLPVVPQTGRRVALVVGCQEYGENRLSTPRADAEAVAKTLKGLGWDVELVEDTNTNTLRAALKKWGGKMDKNTVGLFYFSGLGFSHKSAAYVVPTGVSLQNANAIGLAACVSQTDIVNAMANAKSRIVILNSGRPVFGKESVLDSLTLAPSLPPQTIVAFDSKVGQLPYDVGTQTLNPYAKLLTTELPKSGRAFVAMFQWIGFLIPAFTENKQVPDLQTNFTSDFLTAAPPVNPPVFVRNDPKPTPPVRPVPVAPVPVVPKPFVPEPKPIAANETGEKWALLIGVEKYESDEIRALHFTLRDVAALQKTLPLTGFTPDHILAMTSNLSKDSLNYPTNLNIVKRLSSLSKKLSPNDTLLIYFSGHGFQEQEGGQNFLGSVNADISSLSTLKISAVSLEALRGALKGLQASQLILIMDCCRNNPFKNDAAKGGTDANKRTESFTKDLSRVSDTVGEEIGTAILFACKQGQRSWEDPDAQQGAFTLFLIEALRGKAARDGTLTVNDVGSYVEKRMKEWCINTGKDQSPDYQQYNRARIVIQEGPSAP